jgi:hypothetical protein
MCLFFSFLKGQSFRLGNLALTAPGENHDRLGCDGPPQREFSSNVRSLPSMTAISTEQSKHLKAKKVPCAGY